MKSWQIMEIFTNKYENKVLWNTFIYYILNFLRICSLKNGSDTYDVYRYAISLPVFLSSHEVMIFIIKNKYETEEWIIISQSDFFGYELYVFLELLFMDIFIILYNKYYPYVSFNNKTNEKNL